MKRTLICALLIFSYFSAQFDEQHEESTLDQTEESAADTTEQPKNKINLKGLRPENPNYNFGKFKVSSLIDFKETPIAFKMNNPTQSFNLSFIRLSKVGKLVVKAFSDSGFKSTFKFKLQSSVDGKSWIDIADGKPITGSLNTDEDIQICFTRKFFSRKIKIVPLESYDLSSMNVEVFLSMKDNVNMDQNHPEFISQIKNPKTGRMNGFCNSLVHVSIFEKYGKGLFADAVIDFLLDDLLANEDELRHVFNPSRDNYSLIRDYLAHHLNEISGGPVVDSGNQSWVFDVKKAQSHPSYRFLFKLALEFANIEEDDIKELLYRCDNKHHGFAVTSTN